MRTPIEAADGWDFILEESEVARRFYAAGCSRRVVLVS